MKFMKDYDELLAQRLAKIVELKPDEDLREGSIAHDMASAGALADGQVLFSMETLKDLVFATTSTDEYLDRRVLEIGIVRNKGALATGTIEVSGILNTTIPAGTRFSDVSISLVYESTHEVITTAEGLGEATINIRAIGSGFEYNLGTDSVVQALGDFTEVLTVTNSTPIEGGISRETDEDLLSRYLDKLSNPPVSGNASQYRQWAGEVNGVGGAYVQRLWQGAGTVKVIVMDSDRKSPSSTIVQNVTTYLNDEDRIPIGAEVTVVGAVEVTINIACSVILNAGYTLKQAQDEYTAEFSKYLASVALKQDVVQYNYAVYGFMGLKSTFNFKDLLMNGSDKDILLAKGEIPVMGKVVFMNE